ncbi:MAG: zinc metallopeptidase [Acidobacteria bacterium]|nr:zinc metallopeptidase [Acidobacteriota bacterium]
MRWRGERQSTNIDDRRGIGGKVAVGGGLGTVIVIIIALLFGADPQQLLEQLPSNSPEQVQSSQPGSAEEEELKQFTGVVLGSAVGPFYCPADEKVYIDLAFYDTLRQRMGAPGDFAQAYVVAHEVGHHVQNLLGISDRVHAMQQRMSETEANQLSVRLELQADFFAGMFARYVQNQGVLEAGDVEEALRAASAVGDDRIQKQSRGYVVPDSFTHGTSEQRLRWFKRGYDSGDMRQGDTFSAPSL